MNSRPCFMGSTFALAGLLAISSIPVFAIDQFEAPALFAGGPFWNHYLIAICPADVNNDGHLDVVGVNQPDDSVVVLVGDGAGSFGPPVSFPPESAVDLTVTDLDNDGNQDIALACEYDQDQAGPGPEGCVAILFGHGDGTFGVPNFHEAGEEPRTVEAGDLDGDGDLDLVVVNGGSNDVSVLENEGNGQFVLSHQYQVGADPSFLELGDLNLDGFLDFVVSNQGDDTLTIRRGNGDGTFSGGATLVTGEEPRSFDLADFNEDGKVDIAVTSADSNQLIVYLNLDGFFFYRATTLPVVSEWVKAADFDDDGHLDLVCSELIYPMRIYRGYGDGSFGKPERFDNAGMYVQSLEVADLNEDGRIDIIASSSPTNLVVMLNQGRGTFFNPNWYHPTSGSEKAFDIGDVNNDGIPDVATALWNPAAFIVYLGIGDGSLSPPVEWFMSVWTTSVHILDLNLDGNLDLLAGYNSLSNGGFDIRPGNGDGTFGDRVTYDVGEYVEDVACGDLDGDGQTDLVLVDGEDDQIIVFSGRGDLSFERGASTPVGGYPEHIDIGDLDDDGDLDVAVSNRDDNTVSILLGNGDGSFGPTVDYGPSGAGDVVFADLTNDGHLDLAKTGSGLAVYAGIGDGTLLPPVWYEAGYYPTTLAVGDVDEDGLMDVVVGSFGRYAISLLPGAEMSSQQNYLSTHYATEIALHDMNNDGHLDAVMTSLSGLNIMLNNIRRFSTVTTDLTCIPAAGTLPFSCRIQCRVRNHWHGKRRVHAGLDAWLADGTLFENWRSADLVLDDIEERSFSWIQSFPALPGLMGENLLRLTVTDISPPPYNQPPFPTSGWTRSDECIVEGLPPAH